MAFPSLIIGDRMWSGHHHGVTLMGYGFWVCDKLATVLGYLGKKD
jgi:hypothetical protein